MKSLGKANALGVPKEEMLLAQAVSSVRAAGVRAGQRAFFRDGACCVLGALNGYFRPDYDPPGNAWAILGDLKGEPVRGNDAVLGD